MPPPNTDAEHKQKNLLSDKPHLQDPPPRMDYKYGSMCYLMECDHDAIIARTGIDPVHVMSSINLRRQEREKSRYLSAKDPIWMQQSTARSPKYCRICSQHRGPDGTVRIYNHSHHSSMIDRAFPHVDNYGRYFCIGCNHTHSVKSGVRYNIVCSSSTLHNWRGNTSMNQYAGDYMHCDLILSQVRGYRTTCTRCMRNWERQLAQ